VLTATSIGGLLTRERLMEQSRAATDRDVAPTAWTEHLAAEVRQAGEERNRLLQSGGPGDNPVRMCEAPEPGACPREHDERRLRWTPYLCLLPRRASARVRSTCPPACSAG